MPRAASRRAAAKQAGAPRVRSCKPRVAAGHAAAGHGTTTGLKPFLPPSRARSCLTKRLGAAQDTAEGETWRRGAGEDAAHGAADGESWRHSTDKDEDLCRQTSLEGGATCSTRASEADVCILTDWELEPRGAAPEQLEEPQSPVSEQLEDVVVDSTGAVALLPVGGGRARLLSSLPGDELVTVRVFRFFEDREDECTPWEKELRNVNSGSLLWLVVHSEPRMHSVAGAKYGQWFTAHHLRVRARHLCSGYQVCEDGRCPAKAFGASPAISSLVTGQALGSGYMWFVSPDGSCEDVAGEGSLHSLGWQHLAREGPFDGEAFLAEWRGQGSPMEETRLQQILGCLAH